MMTGDTMKRFLAIDIGGSSVKHAVIDKALNLENQASVPAPRESLEQFVECIGTLYDSCKNQIEGIAISLAATVNPQNGYIFHAGVLCRYGIQTREESASGL